MSDKNSTQHYKLLFLGALFVIGGVFLVAPILLAAQIFFSIKIIFERIKIANIKWAPIRVPIKRRLETFVAFLLIFLVLLLLPTFLILNYILMYYLDNFYRAVIIMYWIYEYYRHHLTFSATDGFGCSLMRNHCLGKYGRAYFPVELVKTTELKPDKNYLLACFPHGIISFGPLINMAMDIEKWLQLFPGIKPKAATLDVNFCLPILQYLLCAFGFVSVSKESLLYYLQKSNDPKHPDNMDGFTSYAISVSVGGAQEASDAQPGQYKLTLKNRKGFIKIAIISGASIVPSFTFNENEVYEQIIGEEGSILHYFQYYAKKLFGIWPSIIIGRGFFQYSFGVLPQRRRLVQVVGAPIEVIQTKSPDAAYIDEIHEKFVEDLTELFETHKMKYLYAKDAELIIT